MRTATTVIAAVLIVGCGAPTPAQLAIPLEPSLRAQAPPPNAYARPLGAAVDIAAARDDAAYRRVLTTTFTSVTPENAVKWNVVQPDEGRFDFAPMDAFVQYAEATRKRIRGHPLLWHEQLPSWLTEGKFTPQQMADVIRGHVQAVMSRYRGRIAEWDVVNEPLEEHGKLRRNVFLDVLGPAYIDIAFKAAREADPGAALFLNQIGAEPPSSASRALLKLMKSLKRHGVPVDGVGLQNHRLDGSASSRRQFAAVFADYHRLGLKVAITEMDMVIHSPSDRPRQARAYAAVARACVAAPNCTGLTVWGVTDKYSWIGPAGEPVLFDTEARPKPALGLVLRALRR
jgi:endo-1,4-beta-xylanase